MSTQLRGIVLALAALALATRLNAQSQSCTTGFYCEIDSLYDGICRPLVPATAYDCHVVIFADQGCTVRNNSCPASPECPSCNRAAHPIDLATGSTLIGETDVKVPGLGGGLSLTRTWSSIWPPLEASHRVGIFGPNWRSTYEESVFPGSDGYMKYSRGDGSYWSFGYSTGGSDTALYALASPANQAATLTQSRTGWTLAFKNGETRTFDINGGRLLSVIDRNGNTTQLAYDASNRLATVTDPGGRHLYFGYTTNGSLVTSLTSDIGLSLAYSYDNQGRLSGVTNPDQTTISFVYDNNSMITAVKDSQGKVLEAHTYDSAGRGLSSSRANGVESVTISFTQ